MMKFLGLFLVSSTLILSGCLKTMADLRGENNGDQEQQKQTASQQQREKPREREVVVKEKPAPANAVSRFEEYDEQMRNINGRMDALENHLTQNSVAAQGEKTSVTEMAKYTDAKFLAFEQELKKLQAQVAELSEELSKQKAAPAAVTTASASKTTKTAYDEGEELFSAKKWKEAIVSFQKYRDSYPKGKQYADSTYKIGICFQELKMKDESRAFFEEVIAKFPNSKEAKKAAFRMKTLK